MPAFAGSVRIAVDIGGTFTDLQILDEATGQTAAHKVPTTPADPSEGLMRGIAEAAERLGFEIARVSGLMHGTTIATNAVLQRRLARGALIATAGFEDVLEIGRHVRREIYSRIAEPRTLLIPRRHRWGVRERLDAAGEVVEPLDEADARRVAAEIRSAGIDVVVVSLLHAYANPAHEERLAAILRAEIPGCHVSRSSAISPEIREFERTSTAVLNALLMPVVASYIEKLGARAAAAGFAAPIYLVQSNGGVTTPAVAAEEPARLILSGPSGGALAAETLAAALGRPNLVAVDMGGTSFDISIVHDGHTRLVTQGEIDGCPVRLPMIEIRTIGAGGGSIAAVDATGRLSVGPASAGAVPGPACYGRGGRLATVTDANVVLGRLDPGFFLGGTMRLDGAAARQAVADGVAGPLGLGLEAAAAGLLAVGVATMANATRLSLFEKGLDPKDFAVVSFGGAAGLHAVEVAEALGADTVIFPRDPGTLSAWGMLFADIVHDLARSRLVPALAGAVAELAPLVATLRQEGDALLARDGVPAGEREFRFALDLRYKGQAYEITVPLPDRAFDADALAEAAADFHRRHAMQYAHSDAAAVPDVVTVRLAAVGRLAKPRPRPFTPAERSAAKGARRIWIERAWVDVPVHDRDALGIEPLAGPAIIEEPHSTLYLPPGWTMAPAATGDLVATWERPPAG
ncbi:N-methylhydantoinase A [Stella humosa]|uniref:N-methylhydantoinase A n=1 Tax=Stella humosa TaxID=94 RepID=A0A3N1MAD4_9PROT|nr:hydantoinase/oxoprolinase family protein [Stella humosa]ROQ00219.1 N-methylhydantoinase A [Stella humosa]BBK30546.1 methylhydantoinase [Stella humosa]